jgi:sec-independent protein translocase protein TatA
MNGRNAPLHGKEDYTVFSMPDMAVILVVILIIFGAGKLPEIGSALGKGLKDFKKAVEEEPPKKPEEKIEAPESKPALDDSSNAPRG